MNQLVLNPKKNNFIKVFPLKESNLEPPVDKREQILWCRELFDKLKNSSNAKRKYVYTNRFSGIMISVWVLDDYSYLIHNLRNEMKTFNTTMYINNSSENAVNDFISCAKFLVKNQEEITRGISKAIGLTDRPTDNTPTPDIPLVA